MRLDFETSFRVSVSPWLRVVYSSMKQAEARLRLPGMRRRSSPSGRAAATTAARGTRLSRSAPSKPALGGPTTHRYCDAGHRRAGREEVRRHRSVEGRSHLDRHRRVRSRARRRHRARLARAARRRARHRQVHAAAAGRGELRAHRRARCSTRRARNPSTRSSRAAIASASATRRSTCSPKPASSASSKKSAASSRR